MRNSSIATLLWLCLLASPPGSAVEVPGLYTAQVTVDERAEDPRAEAYRAALGQVLRRVSGSELAGDPLLIDELFPNPGSYVVQFRRGQRDTIWVSFDGDAIERTLRASGQTVWGGDRPLTLVWLAVDWGQGKREIVAADEPETTADELRTIDRNRLLRERLLEIAQQRGLPVAFPLLDSEDLQKVSFSDVWGGFDEPLREASKRYEARSVLIGRVRPGSSQRNRWSYYFGGQERSWTGEPEVILTQVADLLAAEFAIGGDEPLRSVPLTVSGIFAVEHFAAVQKILREISAVERAAISRVDGDSVFYDVDVHGGTQRLRRGLRLGGLVERSGPEDEFLVVGESSATALEFFYSP